MKHKQTAGTALDIYFSEFIQVLCHAAFMLAITTRLPKWLIIMFNTLAEHCHRLIKQPKKVNCKLVTFLELQLNTMEKAQNYALTSLLSCPKLISFSFCFDFRNIHIWCKVKRLDLLSVSKSPTALITSTKRNAADFNECIYVASFATEIHLWNMIWNIRAHFAYLVLCINNDLCLIRFFFCGVWRNRKKTNRFFLEVPSRISLSVNEMDIALPFIMAWCHLISFAPNFLAKKCLIVLGTTWRTVRGAVDRQQSGKRNQNKMNDKNAAAHFCWEWSFCQILNNNLSLSRSPSQAFFARTQRVQCWQ